MIGTAELLRGFNSDHIADILYNTKDMFFPERITADIAEFVIGYIEALFTELHVISHADQCRAEFMHFFLGGFNEMQRQPQGRLLANARKLGKFLNCFFQ
jgi:hypothetical protein